MIAIRSVQYPEYVVNGIAQLYIYVKLRILISKNIKGHFDIDISFSESFLTLPKILRTFDNTFHQEE